MSAENQTTWLDRVLAGPVLGVMFMPSFRSQHENLTRLGPVLTAWREQGQKIEFVDLGVTNLQISSNSGLTYTITSEGIVVQHQYKQTIVDVPGILPRLETSPPPQPFSKLLDRVVNESDQIITHLMGKDRRKFRRIGIVADCRIDGASPPPGVRAYLNHLGKPWSNLEACQTSITSVLKEDSDQYYRCHHTLNITAEQEHDIRVRLDWQNAFKQKHEPELGAADISSRLPQWVEQALAYFEQFGRGDLAYGADS